MRCRPKNSEAVTMRSGAHEGLTCPLEKGVRGIETGHQMPGRSRRAEQPCGDGKPVGPDRPLENGISGINKSSSDDRPGPGICDSKYVEDAKAARSVRVWDRVPMKDIGREAVLLATMNLLL